MYQHRRYHSSNPTCTVALILDSHTLSLFQYSAMAHLQKARSNADLFRSQMRTFAGLGSRDAAHVVGSSSLALTRVYPEREREREHPRAERWRERSLATAEGRGRGRTARATVAGKGLAERRRGAKAAAQVRIHVGAGKNRTAAATGTRSAAARPADTVFVKDVRFVATGIGVGVAVGVCIYVCCFSLLGSI